MIITHKHYRNITILFTAILFLLFAAAATVRIQNIEKNLDVLNNFELGHAVVLAAESQRSPAVIDPQSTQQYLPGTKLVLPPLQKDLGHVSYSGSLSKEDAGVHISSDANVASAVFKLLYNETQSSTAKTLGRVPYLQACVRGILVTQDGDASKVGGNAEGSKTLRDGTKVYFYSEPLCKNSELLAYVKNIELY